MELTNTVLIVWGNGNGLKWSRRQPRSAVMELTNAPEPIGERLLRVRLQGSRKGRWVFNSRQPENSLWEESRGFCDSFPAGGWGAEVVSSASESKQSAD